MDTWARLLEQVGAGFEGDADAAAEAFTVDAVFQDSPAEPVRSTRGEIAEYFLAFGGRRERFVLGDIVTDDDRAAISYVVVYRADAHAYGMRGMAFLARRGSHLTSWQGVWVETDEDLSSWGHD